MAVADFSSELQERGVQLEALQDETVDWILGEKVVDFYDAAGGTAMGLAKASLLVAAVSRLRPHFRFKVGFKALDVWRQRAPAVQALTLPRELVAAMASLAVSGFGETGIGACLMMCFFGLLRASEALTLRCKDLFDCGDHFVIRLGVAKRGLEQKAVISDRLAVQFLRSHLDWHGKALSGTSEDLVLDVSYSRLQRWMGKLAGLIGVPGHFTSHGLRRGGATQLYASGTPVATIALLGRWLSERSLREYLRLGELSLLRLAQRADPLVHARIRLLDIGAASAFQVLSEAQASA